MNGRSNIVIHKSLLGLCGLLIAVPTGPARADGGKLQLSEKAGSWQVSVFTTPTPIRVGRVDLSVLVQDAATSSLISNAHIIVRADPPPGGEEPIVARASYASASNRMLQAAILDLPQPGTWTIRLTVEAEGTKSELHLPITVAPALPHWEALWPWLTLPAWPILLFAAHHLMRIHDQRRPLTRESYRMSGRR